MLWCDACAAERMCRAKSSFEFSCDACGGKVNVVAASGIAKKRRAERRAAKTGQDAPDPAYRAWIASQGCLRCGKAPSHAHHSVHKSQGGSDRSCVPLCERCHGAYHGQLGSPAAALAAWGIDLRAEARRLAAAYGAPEDDASEPEL